MVFIGYVTWYPRVVMEEVLMFGDFECFSYTETLCRVTCDPELMKPRRYRLF